MEMKFQEIGLALIEELLRERKTHQAVITELETWLAPKTELEEGICSQCKLKESENKKKIEVLENELKSVQEKMKDMEARHDAASRKLSEEGRAKEETCLIKVEKEDARAMVNKWVPPPGGYLKLNVDALNSSTGFLGNARSERIRTGVGAVIRDHKGKIYHSMYFMLSSSVSDFMLKVIAMREGLRWVETLSLPDRGLIVETDCLVLAEQLPRRREEWSEYGLAIMECRALLRSFGMDVVVKHVKREANILARALAAYGRCSYDMLHDQNPSYCSDIPCDIEAIVDSELSTEFKKKVEKPTRSLFK